MRRNLKKEVSDVIDALKNTDMTLADIAKKFNTSVNTIYLINRGESYHNKGIEYPIRIVSKTKKITNNVALEIKKTACH